MPHTDSAPRVPPSPLQACALLLALLAAQVLLLANPGYFSHDELQWAAMSDVPWPALPWVDWFDVRTFQYRPLTFNLWLAISHALFERPILFHALWVLLGSVNALLLARVLLRARVAPRVAAAAALLFALNPYAAYVHGWVATLADLLWLGIALLLTAWLQRRAEREDATPGPEMLVAALAAALALLAKEAALVFPALACVAALVASRRRVWLAAAAGSGAAVAVYLALRLGPMLDGARPGSGYALSLLQVPQRWIEYLLFPWLPTLFEMQSVLRASPARLAVLAAIALALIAMLWRAGPRFALAWVLGSAAALGPVLILAQAANQYGYGLSALGVGVVALAWPRLGRERAVVAIAALLLVWHGVNVQREMHRVGALQARFSPALADALRTHAGPPLRLQVAEPGDAWIYTRLVHHIPSYAGVPIGARVTLVAPPGDVDAIIERDGRLRRVRAP
ncbi:hypothetical protein [Chiayiivirga flava]|uniref:Glycosyltransferase RgtA/B/C/D-like domain-containing protein n=1 Tax=Chiayiivirga flava TaxID=659595 RepID=A0A7W8D9P0_9GAMM|nr:hypothetical protein [Chiayiivirga flava]MBB5209340.1 hypothetical protein [Chiayiivirga flava]